MLGGACIDEARLTQYNRRDGQKKAEVTENITRRGWSRKSFFDSISWAELA